MTEVSYRIATGPFGSLPNGPLAYQSFGGLPGSLPGSLPDWQCILFVPKLQLSGLELVWDVASLLQLLQESVQL